MLNVHGTDYTSVYRPQKVHFFLLWFSLEYSVVFFFFFEVHGYDTMNTRSSNKFYIPFSRTNIRKFSVFYQGPVFFNKLKAFICDAPSLYSFQSRVKNFLLSCY